MSTETPTANAPRPWDRRPEETPAAWRGFCAYRDESYRPDAPYREQRSLARAAALLNHSSTRQVCRWSSAHDWVARCEAYDAHLLEERRRRLAEGRIAIAVEREEARLELQRRRLRAVLGDPEVRVDPEDPESPPDPRWRGLVDGLLDIIADPLIKGGPKVKAWQVLEDGSGLSEDEDEDEREADREAVFRYLQTMARALDEMDRTMFLALLRKADARLRESADD